MPNAHSSPLWQFLILVRKQLFWKWTCFCKVDLTNWPLAFVSVCGFAQLLGVVFCMKPSFLLIKIAQMWLYLKQVRTLAIMTRIWGFWKLFKFFLFLFWLVRLPVINQDLRKNVVIFFLLSSSWNLHLHWKQRCQCSLITELWKKPLPVAIHNRCVHSVNNCIWRAAILSEFV